MSTLLVFLGAGVGGALRFAVTNAGLALGARGWAATLAVNVAGSLLMGVLAGAGAARPELTPEWRLVLGTGLLGGFTTFSAFSLDAVTLFEEGRPGAAGAYVAVSVAASIGALALGYWLMRGAIRG